MARLLAKSWIESFMEYINDPDIPENFLWWSAVSVVSAALRKNIYFRRKFITVYPNQYIILIGPPSSGKGSSMQPAIKIMRDSGVTWYIKDRVSIEKIVDKLQGGTQVIPSASGTGMVLRTNASVILIATELETLLSGTSQWMLPAMCQMWDENTFDYATKNKGSYALKETCTSLFGACVPEYIQALTKAKNGETISGGFSSRCVFPFVAKSKPVKKEDFWGRNTNKKKHQDFGYKLVEDLKAIMNLYGEYTFTPQAYDTFADVSTSFIPDPAAYASEMLVNFEGRIWSHIGKAALCIAAASHEVPVIEEAHVLEAYKRVKEVHDSLDKALKYVSDMPLADISIKIMDYIERKGTATYKDVLRTFHRHATQEDIGRCLLMLESIDFCLRKVQNNQNIYTHNKNFKG